MTQSELNYSDVMALKFKEEFCHDSVFEKEHGFQHSIITYNLTDNIELDFDNVSRLCELIVQNSDDEMQIIHREPVMDLDHLKKLIKLFKYVNLEIPKYKKYNTASFDSLDNDADN